MKVPVLLQYALTRNNNCYLVKNLNNQVFSKDPANVFGRNTAFDHGMLRERDSYLVASKDKSKVIVGKKKSTGRITKRRGKKSCLSAKRVTFTSEEFTTIKTLGRKHCPYVYWKVVRAEKARRRGRRLAANAEKN